MAHTPQAGPGEVSGNGAILAVEREGDGWRVAFASEPRTSPQPLWFHVQVSGLSGAPVSFVWEIADITLGSRDELPGARPVLRADGGPWVRAETAAVVELPDGRRQVHFAHAGGADAVAAALCYPYGPAHLDATLAELHGAWERSPIGITAEGRTLERLRLTGVDAAAPRPGVYLMARQHAGETPGSWILDGLLRHLASDDARAREIARSLDVWVAPFVDLDGVVNGNYGKDALPWDFNRAWEPMAMRPAVHALQRDLQRFADRTAPRLVIDLHAPGHCTGDIYLQLPREQRPQAQQDAARAFAELFAPHFPELEPESFKRETRYSSRWNALATLGSWVWDYLDNTPCVTIETSYQRIGQQVLEIADYRAIGPRVITTALAWLRERA